MTFLNLLEYQSGKSTNYKEISFLFHSKVEELKQSLKIRFIDGLSNAIDFRNMIILSFRDRYVH